MKINIWGRSVKSSLCAITAICMLPMLEAAYNPGIDVKSYPKEDVKKGISMLRMMTQPGRQACMAERMGLLFSITDESAYKGDQMYNETEKVKYYEVRERSQFVGSNGKLYDFYDEMHSLWDKKSAGKISGRDLWQQAKQAIGMVGDEPILVSFAAELTKMAQQTAKFHLKSMPQLLREAWLAQMGGLLYMPDGSKAYGAPRTIKRYGTIGLQQTFTQKGPKVGAMFIDSQGQSHVLSEVIQDSEKVKRNIWAWDHASWCASLVGEKDILSLFSKEMKLLTKQYETHATVDKGSNATPDKPKPETETTSRKTQATPRPEPIPAGPQLSGKFPALDALKKMPAEDRDTLLAELFGLVYKANFDKIYGFSSIPQDVIFMDGEGVENQLAPAHERLQSGALADTVSFIRSDYGAYPIYYTYHSQLRSAALLVAGQIMKVLPTTTRDAWLAMTDRAIYLKDGKNPFNTTSTNGLFPNHLDPFRTMVYTPYFDVSRSLFTDSTGKQQLYADCAPTNGQHKEMERWRTPLLLLTFYANLTGRETVLSLCPAEVEAIRSGYAKAPGVSATTFPALSADANLPEIAALKALPDEARLALLANIFNALYKQDASYPWSGPNTASDAKYTSPDGTEHDFQTEFAKLPANTRNTLLEQLNRASRYEIFCAFAEDILAMARHAAKKVLDSLPLEERDAILAELADLSQLGPNTAFTHTGRYATMVNLPIIQTRDTFIDSKGKSHRALELRVYEKNMHIPNSPARARAHIYELLPCLGRSGILALYPDEVKVMRKYREEENRKGSPLGTSSNVTALGAPKP